jgi:hypothetical protein
MSYVPVGSKWKCGQGGGLEIVVISVNDERNEKPGYPFKKMRTGDVIYCYTHNGKIGSMKQYTQEQWESEWHLISM